MKSTEKMVQKHILGYLDHIGILAWRNNSGVMFSGNYRFQLAPPGSPDIIGMTKEGRWLGIEVKDVKGKQNENQVAFQQKVEQNGGLYILARSIEDVEKALGS